MSLEPRHKRIERIREELRLGEVGLADVEFLLIALDECTSMLRAGQNAVDDAARRWRKIGYEDGYAAGYDDALEHAAWSNR